MIKAGLSACALLAVGLLMGQRVARSESPRAASVSLQRILADSIESKAASRQLETLRLEKSREVGAKQKEVEELRQQLMQAGGLFQGSRRAKLQADEERARGELQRITQQAQSDVAALQRKLNNDLRSKLSPIFSSIARRRGVEVIFNEDNALVWAVGGTDVTAEVVQRLNAEAPKSSEK